jgi:predicted Zn finger-like uncharacterized protein
MRIRCPSCSATYDVPAALISPPRTVRCAQCAHDWVATPVAEDDTPYDAEHEAPAEHAIGDAAQVARQDRVDEIEPPIAMDRLVAIRDPAPRRGHLLTVAWAASFVVLAGLGFAGYAKRDAMMEHWPASKRIYATLGLAQGPVEGGGEKAGR